MHRPAGRILLAVLAVVSACHGDGSLAPARHGTLHLLAGNGTTDTVQAMLVQALVVQLLDDRGKPLPGIVIRYQTVPPSQDQPAFAYVTATSRNSFSSVLSDSTDARGRSSAVVALGTIAGTARVTVSAPALDLVDTAVFTVRPGAAAAVHVSPRDTALVAGGSIKLSATVTDRFGNPRTDPVTHAMGAGNITLSTDQVTATGIGRAFVVAHTGAAVDTEFVSVVPAGEISAGSATGVAVFNTDGSGFRWLTGSTTPGYITDWSPDGTEIAFDTQNATGTWGPLWMVDLAGKVRPASLSSSQSQEAYPEFSPDGKVLYFCRRVSTWQLRRVDADGTNDQPVATSMYLSFTAPSVSPDGTRLVYAVLDAGVDVLSFLDLATGQATNTPIRGDSPSWSPLGDLVAFIDASASALIVMNPDGSGLHQIGTGFDFGIDWSSDGKWIVARSRAKNVIELIDPRNDVVLPLGFTHGLVGPSLKP